MLLFSPPCSRPKKINACFFAAVHERISVCVYVFKYVFIMYVCVLVCMYVCVHFCVFASMYVSMYLCTNVSMSESIDVFVSSCLFVRNCTCERNILFFLFIFIFYIYICMYVCMYVSMYV